VEGKDGGREGGEGEESRVTCESLETLCCERVREKKGVGREKKNKNKKKKKKKEKKW